MTYQRVIPRDLFNEAKLLKCLGQLFLNLEGYNAFLSHISDEQFEIEQREWDGGIYCSNLEFFVRGKEVALFTPLNSRGSYPLIFEDENTMGFVFNDDGSFSESFIEYLKEE